MVISTVTISLVTISLFTIKLVTKSLVTISLVASDTVRSYFLNRGRWQVNLNGISLKRAKGRYTAATKVRRLGWWTTFVRW